MVVAENEEKDHRGWLQLVFEAGGGYGRKGYHVGIGWLGLGLGLTQNEETDGGVGPGWG